MSKVLEVDNLVVSFKTDNGLVRAVRGVSFDLEKGETLCIVGESGSGKSVTSKAIMGILANNAIIDSGSIIYEGENILNLTEDAFHKIRGSKIGMIFQDPLSSLNPIVRIGKQITEATLVNGNKLKHLLDEYVIVEQTNLNKAIAEHNAIVSNYNNSCYQAIIKKTEKSESLINAELQIEKILKVIDSKEAKGEIVTVEEKSEYKVAAINLKTLTKERNSLIKTVTKEEKNIIKPLIKEEKLRFAPIKKDLKAKLNAKKKEGKVHVSEYKAKVCNEKKETLTELKNRLASTNDEAKKNEIKAEISEKTDFYNNQLKTTKRKAKEQALQIMREVGIPQPELRFKQYPFEFSGGMRQRIVIAIALTANPDVLICDEPTTALDVTIQAQILDLINRLKVERQLSCIFITHDLGVVANMADRVAVMYAGKIVEYGEVNEIFYEPKHPYTWALLSSVPDVDSEERLDAIPGTPPNMIYPPRGDAFALRSKYAMNIDFKEQPPYFKVSETHYAATWLLHKDAPSVEMPSIVSQRIKQSLKGGK